MHPCRPPHRGAPRPPPKPLIPPRPNVHRPTNDLWSKATWTIHDMASSAALRAIAEGPDEPHLVGSELEAAKLRLLARMRDGDLELKREVYERTIFFIDRCSAPTMGWSLAGAAMDRAHARLRAWIELYE